MDGELSGDGMRRGGRRREYYIGMDPTVARWGGGSSRVFPSRLNV